MSAVKSGRIYEVFPLLCRHDGKSMTIIAFVTDGDPLQRLLEHLSLITARA